MHGRHRFLLLLLFLGGCAETPATEKKPPASAAVAMLGAAFDQKATGTITGTAMWEGDPPHVAPFKIYGLPGDYPVDVRQDQPNPNAPRIHDRTGEQAPLEGAVVFLRHVDLEKSRPWDQPMVHVEQRDRHLLIRQGESVANVGWVRSGESIEVTNADGHFHMLRGRGAAFFSMPFTDQNLPGQRVLDKPGLVELSSGAFFFWMRGYLLVEKHPYFTRTDAAGKFVLDKVPAGDYELVCWMANWEVAKKYRDPETGLIIQADFLPPVEQVNKLLVSAGSQTTSSFTWSASSFAPRPH